jgi:hypothetical protein
MDAVGDAADDPSKVADLHRFDAEMRRELAERSWSGPTIGRAAAGCARPALGGKNVAGSGECG